MNVLKIFIKIIFTKEIMATVITVVEQRTLGASQK